MKVLIEIDEKTYNDVQNGKIYSSSRDVPQESVSAIKNGVTIPDNAKNIDVLMTVFPKADIRFEGRNNNFYGYIEFAGDWLEAPYRKD